MTDEIFETMPKSDARGARTGDAERPVSFLPAVIISTPAFYAGILAFRLFGFAWLSSLLASWGLSLSIMVIVTMVAVVKRDRFGRFDHAGVAGVVSRLQGEKPVRLAFGAMSTATK